MKYAVLGTGMVGHTLATKLVSLGHDVRMGARTADNAKAVAWSETNGTEAGHGTFADVATWADRVIFAVNGANIVEVADAVTDTAVIGKTVIDVTNPLDMWMGMPPTLVPELSNTRTSLAWGVSSEAMTRLKKTFLRRTYAMKNDPMRIEDMTENERERAFAAADQEIAKDRTCTSAP